MELAGSGAAPFACTVLADLGADVLRVERPRTSAGFAYDQLTRSRDSVAVDLKNPDGRDLVLSLAERADALVECFRPGVAERLGVGPDACSAANARLVYARLTGYGQDGPLSQRAGHDVNYLAVAGALWPVGRAGRAPGAAAQLRRGLRRRAVLRGGGAGGGDARRARRARARSSTRRWSTPRR